MNDTIRSSSSRLTRLANPLISWAAVALGLFAIYSATTKYLEWDSGLQKRAMPPEANALSLQGVPDSIAQPSNQRREQTPRIDVGAMVRSRPRATSTHSQTRDSADAHTLLGDLFQVTARYTSITEGEAEEVNRYLAGLARLGRDGVPVIREWLASGKDIRFKDMHGGERMDFPSLRAALIDALGEIGGPEAMDALVETLSTTAEPLEIAALARALERQAPGVYRQELLTAARESVEVASQRIIEARAKPAAERQTLDVSPLFDVMRTLGNSDLLSDMLRDAEEVMPPWKVYSMIALAQMSDAEGVDVLRGVLENDEGELARQNLFALQMLAQSAAERPGAAEALVELAMIHGPEIPGSDWRKLAWTLRGNSYDFGGTSAANEPDSSGGSAGRNVTVQSLNLNFRRETSDPATWPAERIDRQISLIDQLLATDPPPAAAYGLESARDWILSRSGQPVAQTSI